MEEVGGEGGDIDTLTAHSVPYSGNLYDIVKIILAKKIVTLVVRACETVVSYCVIFLSI